MQTKLFINGAFVSPQNGGTLPVVNPATEEVVHQIPAGDAADADAAVKAARAAFDSGPWPKLSGKERAVILRKIAQGIRGRLPELARWGLDNYLETKQITRLVSDEPWGWYIK